ncbi:MAG: PEP-utilizing enzyme [Patescibacteria group bacterium]
MQASEVIAKFGLNQKTWVRKGFEGVLQYFFPIGEMPIKPVFDYYGDGHTITIFFFHENSGDWYWNKEDMDRLRKSFVQHVHDDEKYLDNLLTEWGRRLELFKNVMNDFEKTDLTQLSDEGFNQLYLAWHHAYIYQYGLAIAWQDAFSMNAEDFLYPHLKDVIEKAGYPDKVNEYYELLLTPVNKSFLTLELEERLELRAHIERSPGQRVANHARKYHWINNNYAKVLRLTADYFAEQMQQVTPAQAQEQLREIRRQFADTLKRKKNLLAALPLTQETKNLIRIAEVFAYMQDERKKHVLMAVDQQDRVTEEIARRCNLTKKEAQYSFVYELPDLLEGKVDKVTLRERHAFVCVIHTLAGHEIYHGRVAQQIFDAVFAIKVDSASEIKGMIASRGKVEGTVRIILKTHDLANVAKGDVLVASMTRPEMVSAMRKASAIVTDEGGVTSHAAIVSRELGIPCIIGTKVATKALKNGDRVVVDANSGIVKKIA